tara:strand:- start:1189 stop:2397 length:1209 start_codon:yes stop_codon:yes gene_type:complete
MRAWGGRNETLGLGDRLTTAVTTTATNIDFNADGHSVIVDLNIDSSWDGTVDFQTTIDGPNYFNIRYLTLGTLTPAESVSQLTSLSTARYLLPGPLTQVRINCGAGTTGTLTAVYRVVPNGGGELEVLVKEAIDLGLEIQGPVAHDAADAGNPVKIGGKADSTIPDAADDGDIVDARFSTYGELATVIMDRGGASFTNSARVLRANADSATTGDYRLTTHSSLLGLAPDGGMDRLRTTRDITMGLGVLKVAAIGGDEPLRSSAAAGEASGTSTALDDFGWVKSFWARLDVTAVPSGGSPTLDVYIQSQAPSGDWQDIAHFTQVTGSTTAENVVWTSEGEVLGTQSESAAVTVDNYFADQDAALTAATVRRLILGDSMRIKWVFAAGGSTGDYTFAVENTFHA